MSSKRSCFKAIIKSDLRRSWWISALAALFIFMSSTTYLFSYYDIDVNYDYRFMTPASFANDMDMAYFFGMLLSAFVALFIFSYLNKVNSVSFFHSLPITRGGILFAHITSSAILIISPMLVNTFISLFTVARGVKSTWIMFAFLVYVMYCLVVFSVTLVISLLCGSSIASGIFTPIVILLPAYVGLFINDLCTGYLYGYCGSEYFEKFILEWFYLSPEKLYSPRILIYVGYIALFISLSFLLYKKRHLENHGEVIAFTNLKGLFKVLFGICAGVLGYYYFRAFWSITSILTMFVFGAVGTVAAHMLSNKSFSLRGVLKPLGIVCGIVVVLFVSFFFDLFAFENRVPDIDDIEYAEIGDLYYEDWEYFESDHFRSNDIRAIRVDQYKPYFKTKKEIQLFLDLHKYAVENKKQNEIWEDDFITPNYIDTDRSYFTIVYRLKNGTEMKREYYLPERDLAQLTENIYNTDTYRKWKYPVLDGTEKVYKTVSVSDARTYLETTVPFDAGTDQAKMIIEALIKDRENITYDRMCINEHGAMVDIELEYEVPYIDDNGTVYYGEKQDTYSVGKYDVNTWSLLEKLDIFRDQKKIQLDDVKYATASLNDYLSSRCEDNGDIDVTASAASASEYVRDYNNYDYSTHLFETQGEIEVLYDIYMNHHNHVPKKGDDYVVFYLNLCMGDDFTRGRQVVMGTSELPEILNFMKRDVK